VGVAQVSPDRPVTLAPIGGRAVGALAEAVLFVVIAAAVAVVEYFVSGPIGSFGPSNFWIALVILALWSAWYWPSGQTLGAVLTGRYVSMPDGRPAAPLTMAARELSRFGLLYALPLLAFGLNVGWTAVIAAIVGGLIAVRGDRRAPWDSLLGTTVATAAGTSTSPVTAPVRSVQDLKLDPRRTAQNVRARRLLFGFAMSSVVISVLIMWNMFSEAFDFVAAEEFSWQSLTDIGWFPRRGLFDLSTLFVGTLWVTGIAIALAGPVGLGVAFYLSEYASPRVRGFVKPLIETLASIPSVVLGLFAISFIAPTILQPVDASIGIFSLLAAGLGVGVLTVPIVASISEDALRSVPRELREASFGLGARKATTALRVVFPAALSGISAAFIVAISRAIGETMVVYIAAGGSGGAVFEVDPRQSGQTLTAAMASLGAGTDSVAGVGIAFQSLYFLGAVLFVITMVLNVLSDVVVRRFRQVY